jgi:hypothetical protein
VHEGRTRAIDWRDHAHALVSSRLESTKTRSGHDDDDDDDDDDDE